MYRFDFISSAFGVSDYRVFFQGEDLGRLSASALDQKLHMRRDGLDTAAIQSAFNAMLADKYDAARKVYPETGPAPVYQFAASVMPLCGIPA